MKVLALMKYGDQAASTRQRLLQFRGHLKNAGIELEYIVLLNNAYVRRIGHGQNFRIRELLVAYLWRAWSLLRRRDFDLLWVHDEAFPYLPGFVERLCFLSSKPVIYDFDDAIFHQYDSYRNPLVRRVLGRKLEPLLRRVTACSCGNAYLQAYAQQFCPRSIILPTVVATTVYRSVAVPDSSDRNITIGWIGSPSTWTHLKPLVPLLLQLSAELGVSVRIIGAGPVSELYPGVEFIEWSMETEVSEVQRMDIGIMPLPDEPWARGKCGYKLIQYMACGLPVVASPVGVNTDIVRHGENGYLASTDEEWRAALTDLIADRDLRHRMGQAGRARVEADFSLQVQAPRLVELLRSVVL